MNYALDRLTAPAVEPLTTSEAKAHLRVDHSLDDTEIDTLVKVARGHAEMLLDRAIISQSWKLTLDGFYTVLKPLRGPVQSVTHVKYYDGDNVLQTLASDQYELDVHGRRIVPAYNVIWPSTYSRIDAVVVTFVCGFGDAADDVPAEVLHAMKLLLAHYYENREAVTFGSPTELPMGVDSLLSSYRTIRGLV